MKQLINTQIFKLLQKSTFNPAETDITLMYDEFVHSVTLLCTHSIVEVPAYFTLHYTRLELEVHQSRSKTKGAGEKYTNTGLYYTMH